MEYYKQGDAANADKIKAAFAKLGYDTSGWIYNSDRGVYFTNKFNKSVDFTYNELFVTLIKTHPNYKELELTSEPKFKVGDWITNGLCTIQISSIGHEKIKGTSYMMYYHNNDFIGGDVESIDKEYHLWTIADAKDGDVLATDNGWTCIFQAFDGCGFSSYCFMDSQRWFCKVGSEAHTLDSRINGNIHPANKEQCNQFFTKMKEAGYTWDADKKELKKIPKHYDITNFHAGMPVLVRDDNSDEWNYLLFSHYRKKLPDRFFAGGSPWFQCIPLNKDTEHLLGTTNVPSEEYINWKT